MPRGALDRLRTLSLALPEAWEKISHGEPTFWVHKRMFATFASARNHHGAGRDAVWCKAVHMTQEMVVSRWPDRYFVRRTSARRAGSGSISIAGRIGQR